MKRTVGLLVGKKENGLKYLDKREMWKRFEVKFFQKFLY
jgi:hypothetical protein